MFSGIRGSKGFRLKILARLGAGGDGIEKWRFGVVGEVKWDFRFRWFCEILLKESTMALISRSRWDKEGGNEAG